jgi:mercuric ion transport protein
MPWKQYLSVGIAIIACPCHLPLLIAALSGTVIGGWLGQYTLVVTLGIAGIFMLAVLYSFRSFTRQNDTVDDPVSVGARDVNHVEDRGAGI